MTDKEMISNILDMQEQPTPAVDHTCGMSKEEFMAKFLYGVKR